MARQQSGINNGKSMTVEKLYTPVSTMKTVTAAPAATNKSPRKSQKHNNRLDSNGRSGGNHQNGGGANRNASTAAGVNKRDVWRLTSTKQNSRAEYSSSEDLATCSKGRSHTKKNIFSFQIVLCSIHGVIGNCVAYK